MSALFSSSLPHANVAVVGLPSRNPPQHTNVVAPLLLPAHLPYDHVKFFWSFSSTNTSSYRHCMPVFLTIDHVLSFCSNGLWYLRLVCCSHNYTAGYRWGLTTVIISGFQHQFSGSIETHIKKTTLHGEFNLLRCSLDSISMAILMVLPRLYRPYHVYRFHRFYPESGLSSLVSVKINLFWMWLLVLSRPCWFRLFLHAQRPMKRGLHFTRPMPLYPVVTFNNTVANSPTRGSMIAWLPSIHTTLKVISMFLF